MLADGYLSTKIEKSLVRFVQMFSSFTLKTLGTTLEQMLIAKVSGSDFEFAYFGNATNESVWPG